MNGIKKGFAKLLSLSLFIAGIFMALFGIWENIYIICITGFCFFAMLPFANNCLDYLVRTNIDDEFQGRAWGFIGFISQIGYVVAYAICGVSADAIGKALGIGVGRGAGYIVIISGILLAVTALSILPMKSVRALEK